jgi:hypothetical protein
MATNPNMPPDALKNLADIEQELASSGREFRMNIDEIGNKLDEVTKKTLTSYTSVNRAIADALKLAARMQANDEESIKSKNVSKELLTEKVELEARIASITSKQIESYDANKNIIQTTVEAARANYEINKQTIKLKQSELEDLEDRLLHTRNALDKIPLISSIDAKNAEIAYLAELDDLIIKKNGSQMFSLELMQKELAYLEQTIEQYEKISENVTQIEDVKAKAGQKKNFINELLSKVGLGDIGKKYKDIVAPNEELIKSFGAGWAKALGVIGLVVTTIKKIVDFAMKADQATTDFARGMQVTKEEARGALGNLEKVSSTMKEGLFSSRDLVKSQLQLNESLGTTMYMRGEDLKTVTKAREMIGMTEESIASMAKYSFASGKSFEDIKNNIIGSSKAVQIQNGVLLQDKKILEATLKITGGMRANFKGSITDIAASVTQAKNLGTTLENVQTTSMGLLDFEKSISAELEAELVTGKRLNLERMRSAALVGDMNTVMAEMNKQGIDFNEFSNMNVIQQEKLASAFSLSRDQYADMLFEQTALNRMRSLGFSGDQKNLIEEFNRLKASGADVNKLLGEQVSKTLEIQSASEKWNKVIEKFQVILERLFDTGAMDKIITGIANVAQSISENGFMSTLFFGARPDKPYTMQDFGGPLSGKNSTSATKANDDKTASIISAAVKAAVAGVAPTRIIVNGIDMGIAVNKENNKFA